MELRNKIIFKNKSTNACISVCFTQTFDIVIIHKMFMTVQCAGLILISGVSGVSYCLLVQILQIERKSVKQ